MSPSRPRARPRRAAPSATRWTARATASTPPRTGGPRRAPRSAWPSSTRWPPTTPTPRRQPYLAESFTPNADFTRWTVTLRSGVTFHDGTPLTADVLKTIFDAHLASPLTRPAVADLDHGRGHRRAHRRLRDEGSVGGVPVVAHRAARHGARRRRCWPTPTARARPWAPARSRSRSGCPTTTSPWSSNPDYWRKDADGDAAAVPRPRSTSRSSSRTRPGSTRSLAGDIDMADTVGRRRRCSRLDAGRRRRQAPGRREPGRDRGGLRPAEHGQAAVRQPHRPPGRGLRHRPSRPTSPPSTSNVTSPVYNVFREGTPYYREAPYPGLRPGQGQVARPGLPAGDGPAARVLAASSLPDERVAAAGPVPQAGVGAGRHEGRHPAVRSRPSSSSTRCTGNYQAAAWGQFGSPDPDYDYVWWISDNAAPVGQLGLNIARNKDPEIDQALRAARASDDPHGAPGAATPSWPPGSTRTSPTSGWPGPRIFVFANNAVRGITNGPLPDGQASYPMGGPGGFSFIASPRPGSTASTWLDR